MEWKGMIMGARSLSLPTFAVLCLIAAGCGERMEIESDSTTANPSSFQRTIPEDAVETETP